MLFTSAALNFGVNQLLDVLVELAPPPSGALDVDGATARGRIPVQRFRVQGAGRNGLRASRPDRLRAGVSRGPSSAARCSPTRPPASRSPPSTRSRCSASSATTLDDAWPGDVIGLANAAALRPGDTLYRDEPVQYPPIPSFSPEHFAVARGTDPSKHKQFRRGHRAARPGRRGAGAALGPARRAGTGVRRGRPDAVRGGHRIGWLPRLSAPISLESLPYQVARIVDPQDAEFMDKQVSCEVLTRTDGVHAGAVLHAVAVGGIPAGQPGHQAALVGGSGRGLTSRLTLPASRGLPPVKRRAAVQRTGLLTSSAAGGTGSTSGPRRECGTRQVAPNPAAAPNPAVGSSPAAVPILAAGSRCSIPDPTRGGARSPAGAAAERAPVRCPALHCRSPGPHPAHRPQLLL